MSGQPSPRIAVVAPRYPPDLGGLENYARWGVDALRRAGMDVVVVSTHRGKGTLVGEFDGVPVIRLRAPLVVSNTPISPFWFRQLRRIFRERRIDAVVAHSPVPGLADMAVLASGPRPVVFTYHSGSMVKGVGGIVDALLRGYERTMLPWIFRRAERLVAVSPVSMAHHTGRAEMITPGVDTEVFHPDDSPSGDSAPRRADVVFVGRIEAESRWKGIDTLVTAFAAVADRVPQATLHLVGDGNDVERLQGMVADLGLSDRVVWHGALGHESVAEVLRGAGVTVLPSLTESESFGMTLIEAMASGCPVIGSRIGGIPFVIRDEVDGLLVPPGDAEALAAAITRVLEDHDLAEELGRHGREAARDRWDMSLQEQRTVDIVRRALDRD